MVLFSRLLMKKSALFFYIVFQVLIVHAQGSWLNPLPQGNTLNSVFFPDENTGWAVGNFGTIIKTDDGGESWQLVPRQTTETLYDVFFTDSGHGWATGEMGVILRYCDKQWDLMESGVESALYSIEFMDEKNGVACGQGGVMLRTDDGGASWLALEYVTSINLLSIDFPSKTTGYIVGGGGTTTGQGVILKTIDGGGNWKVLSDTLDDIYLYDLDFTDSLTGYAAGNFSYVFKTTDGGKNWESLENPNSSFDFIIRAIDFVDWQTGFTADWYGNIMKTTDAGLNWEVVPFKSKQALFSMCRAGNSAMFLVGGGGTIFSTSDLGETFVNHQQGHLNDMQNLFLFDLLTILAAGDGILVKTFDGGKNWSFTEFPELDQLISSHFLSKDIGFVLTYLGSYKTLDGGQSWIPMYGTRASYLTSIYMKNESVGWITGGGQSPGGWAWATLLKTTNGMDWQEVTVPASTLLNRIYFIDDNNGFILGFDGRLLHSGDGGETWTAIESGTNRNLEDITFTDEETGFIIGSLYQHGNMILATDNGGMNWEVVYEDNLAGFEHALSRIRFYDRQNGYVVGSSGLILRTTDGGQTWETVPGFTDNSLSDIVLLNDSSGLVAGTFGTLASFGSNVNWIPEGNQQSIMAKAWPNPFNSALSIEFFNNRRQKVTVEIFDQAGKQVYKRSEYFGYGNSVFYLRSILLLNEGTYVYRLTGEGLEITGKIVKE